jgi:aminobenzoyl-glutamate utilization protein B
MEYHNWVAAVTPATAIAYHRTILGAKVMAASAPDLLTSPKLIHKARAQFETDTKGNNYFSLLPHDAKPPLDLNRT